MLLRWPHQLSCLSGINSSIDPNCLSAHFLYSHYRTLFTIHIYFILRDCVFRFILDAYGSQATWMLVYGIYRLIGFVVNFFLLHINLFFRTWNNFVLLILLFLTSWLSSNITPKHRNQLICSILVLLIVGPVSLYLLPLFP